ncbi:hypothetical protein M947_06600 [Sulfurimonas hongkongensis]|uniref:Type II secretion system protein n=1 Tax=Sulfurimonas hongkongensis TaxID=1172190 RepID=T0KRS4_9BACT|nr:hypothetical protein [Sulfurimonas hongkongensis]EQB39659.1 hypothetical protein M947_06600 [Sulfurimonas hongkongensis]
MQRKNYILNRKKVQYRSGFAMMMAIIVIVIISTIMALSLSLTTQTAKRTTDIYLYEQAVLYSKSAAELALLEIAQNGSCTTIAPYTLDGIYDINVTLKYVYKGLTCGGDNDYFTTIQTDEQNGSVLMDITVTTNEGTEPIRYFRRSIQKL